MKLFEPIKIRSMLVPNRIVYPAIQLNLGMNSRRARAFFSERARGGVDGGWDWRPCARGGIEAQPVDPASDGARHLEVRDRHAVARSDRRRLAQGLRRGELEGGGHPDERGVPGRHRR